MTRPFVLVLILFFAGCRPLQTASLSPTQAIRHLGYLPALLPWVDRASGCAAQIPELSITYHEITGFNPQQELTGFDMVLQYSYNLPATTFNTLLGTETVSWIVNAANPADQITSEQFTAIFNGGASNWDQITGEGYPEPVQLWIYPPGDPLNAVMQDLFAPFQANLTGAFLAPDPDAMLAAVSDRPGALGYLPASWLEMPTTNPVVKTLSMTKSGESIAEHTLEIVAVTPAEPAAEIRLLVLCMQER